MKARVRYEVLEKDGTWKPVTHWTPKPNGWLIWKRRKTGLTYMGVAGPGNWRAVEIIKKGKSNGSTL
jgi:hypothetical protein